MFSFHLNQKDLDKILIATKEVARVGSYYAKVVLPRRLARGYILHLIDSISTQRYSTSYAPYNKDYRTWKSLHSTRHIFWYLGGDFLKALTTFKVYNGWFAGIPYEVKDVGWKSFGSTQGRRANQPTHIAVYGWIMEEGGDYSADMGGDHPARPLFKPALEDFAKYMVPVEINNTVVPQIKKAWS